MWTTFKAFIEFITILLLFYVLFFFGCEVCVILVPWIGIKPAPPALEREVLKTRLPVKSLRNFGAYYFLHHTLWSPWPFDLSLYLSKSESLEPT